MLLLAVVLAQSNGIAKVIELLGATGELKAPLPAADRFVDLEYLRAAGLE